MVDLLKIRKRLRFEDSFQPNIKGDISNGTKGNQHSLRGTEKTKMIRNVYRTITNSLDRDLDLTGVKCD